MKTVIDLILFLLALVCAGHVADTDRIETGMQTGVEEFSAGQLQEDHDPCLYTLIAANRMADVNVQPVRVLSPQGARRYRPAGFLADRMAGFLQEEQCCMAKNCFKQIAELSEIHASQLQHQGYYVYALRKIIL